MGRDGKRKREGGKEGGEEGGKEGGLIYQHSHLLHPDDDDYDGAHNDEAYTRADMDKRVMRERTATFLVQAVVEVHPWEGGGGDEEGRSGEEKNGFWL